MVELALSTIILSLLAIINVLKSARKEESKWILLLEFLRVLAVV